MNQIPPDIKQFLLSIITEANLQLPEENQKEQVVQELYDQLDQFMLSTIIENLPEDKLTGFNELALQGAKRDQLEEYLKANIPNYQEVFAQALIAFHDTYLETTNTQAKPNE